jgi:hypothetical protein
MPVNGLRVLDCVAVVVGDVSLTVHVPYGMATKRLPLASVVPVAV